MKNLVKQNKNIGSPIYYKSFAGEFKADTSSRKVSGYFNTFNIVDSDNDVIRPGAFSKSIQERGPGTTGNRKIKYLHQHNATEIAGPLTKLFEDSTGLGFEGELENTPLGDVILERYANGTYNEHSIGFMYDWSKCNWIMVPVTAAMQADDEQDGTELQIDPNAPAMEIQVFECKELILFEGSVVTFGANSNTPFTGFKGTPEEQASILARELEFLLRKSPNYEHELQIRALWAKQMALSQSLVEKNTREAKRSLMTQPFDYTYLCNNLNF